MESMMTEASPTPPQAEAPPPAPETVTLPIAEVEGLRKKAAEREEFLADLQRVQADFVNFQKRNARERDAWGQMLTAKLIRDLLPSLDNFDRAAHASMGIPGTEKFLEGLQLIEREIFRVLELNGLKALETVGKPFDANEHEVVMVEENGEVPDQTVLAEVRKGYRLGGTVLRPAQVKVSRCPSPRSAEGAP